MIIIFKLKYFLSISVITMCTINPCKALALTNNNSLILKNSLSSINTRDSRVHLDVGNFGGFEYVDPNDSKTYWVKVGDPFNFDVNSATLKPSNISPTENRIDMWDGSTLRHLTGQDKNGSQTYYTNSGFDSDFKVNSVTHKRPTMTNYNWLITCFSIIPLHHGKTYEGWFTGGYNSSFVSEKYTGQKIKTDDKAPVTAFGTHTSDASTVTFRYNNFKDIGLVRSIVINPGSKFKFISVETLAEIPLDYSVEGKIYYKQKENGNMDYSKFINFDISSNGENKIIAVSKHVSKIQVDLVVRGNSNKFISPTLDNIRVFAK